MSTAEPQPSWRPYMETCSERFGPDRCIFESNFPVEKLGTSWAVLWNAFTRIAAGAAAEEKPALFSGAARASIDRKPARHARQQVAGKVRNRLQSADKRTLNVAKRFPAPPPLVDVAPCLLVVVGGIDLPLAR